MSDIFISYAREDALRVKSLADEFKRLGWSVWCDNNIGTSAEYDAQIERELDVATCVVVVWSRSSIKSDWVRAESDEAHKLGKLVPVSFESDVAPPLKFRQLNIARLSSASLANPTESSMALLTEISSRTRKSPKGMNLHLAQGTPAGGRSGAKTVTPGTWRLTFRILLSLARMDLELLPSGIVTGKGAWAITRSDFSGRWHFDSSRGILQLEVFGPTTKGMESRVIQIVSWEDDDTALCTFERRNARLKRVIG
jgi:hypothetical protein